MTISFNLHLGYRRITAEVEERHIIGRKFFERCGFQCEAVLRKHKVLHNRNSNTALYTVLNSDFVEVERRLKLFLGIPLTAPMQKIAAIDGASAAVEAEAVARQGGVTGVAGSSAGSSSKKNAKKGLKRKSKDNRINIVW